MSGEHVRRRTTYYDHLVGQGPGYVAWCSCGVGTPLKATKAEAERSLAVHIANPQEHRWPA